MKINDHRVPGILSILKLGGILVWTLILVLAAANGVLDFAAGERGLIMLVYPALVILAGREIYFLVAL